uniref:Uncharacterized protein n=1 Tax=Rhizophora mucronata TaxID=61149 RepID=A0A2P2L6F3_RHIMU
MGRLYQMVLLLYPLMDFFHHYSVKVNHILVLFVISPSNCAFCFY